MWPTGAEPLGFLGRSRAERIRRKLEQRPRRILVVDRDPAVLARLAEVLRGEGLEVETLPSGADLLLRSDLNRFDLAVIDAHTPTDHGAALLPALRETAQGAALPVVLMATDLVGETLARGRELRCAGFVTKPVDERIFVETIRALLA